MLLVAVAVTARAEQTVESPAMLEPYTSPTNDLGSWVWSQTTFDRQVCHFWKTFEIPANNPVVSARLVMTVDNEFTLYMDGHELGHGAEWRELFVFDVSKLLTPGQHVLAVDCFNGSFSAGLLFGLRITLADGQIIAVKSDDTWRVIPDSVAHWETLTEAQPAWPATTIQAALGGLPWWSQPAYVNMMPVPHLVVVHFWQTGWFQLTLLILSSLAVVIILRLAAQLAFHRNERQLLQRERARIAREIHDDIGSRMTELVLHGEELQSGQPSGSPLQLQLGHLCEEIRGALGSMDEVLWAVNPRRDTLHDFTAYVCKYAQKFLHPTGIECLLDVEPGITATACDLPLRRSLLMAVKEALNNAVKYSEATELLLKIQWQDRRLVIIVRDNGKGFDPAKANPERNGLTNMAQRMTEIGGHFRLHSQPGQGCRIEFSIPLKPQRPRSWPGHADPFSEPPSHSRNTHPHDLN